MVGIVAVTKFCEASSSTFSSYIDYIDRDEATRTENDEKYDLFNNYLGYMDNAKKTNAKGDADIGQSSLFTKHSDKLTDDEKKELKKHFKEAQENGSNMWQTVISFDNDYLRQNGILNEDTLNEKQLIQAARKAVGTMLEAEGLDNALWSGAIHYNTDNIHIHIATVERVPHREKKLYRQWVKDSEGKFKTEIDSLGKKHKIPLLDANGNQILKESFKGRFKQSSIEKLKSGVVSELETNKDSLIEINSLLRGIVNDKKERSLIEVPDFALALDDLYDKLKASGVDRRSWRYNQNSLSEIRPILDSLSKQYIDTYHAEDYDELIKKLENKSVEYAQTYGGENKYIESKLYDRRDGLYTRLANAILKELIELDKRRQESESRAFNAYTNIIKAEGDIKKQAEAFEILTKEASLGNTFALNRLGIMYMQGEYVEKDLGRAKESFEKSMKLGDEYGYKMYHNIGTLTKGRRADYKKDLISAKRDMRRACQLLKRSMHKSYQSFRNQLDYEELQREIANRGTDKDLKRLKNNIVL